MDHSSDDGINVVKPKRCRAGQGNAQGTTHVVRKQRMQTKIDGLTKDIAVLQAEYDVAVRQGAVVLAERDSARYELKAAENTSAHRLLLIENEVPDFVGKMNDGAFDCYALFLQPGDGQGSPGDPGMAGRPAVATRKL